MTTSDPNLPPRDAAARGFPWSTVIGLVIASFIVGGVLSLIGLNPVDFWTGLAGGIAEFFQGIVDMGWGAVTKVVTYIAFGALIVVPIWGVAKLLSGRK